MHRSFRRVFLALSVAGASTLSWAQPEMPKALENPPVGTAFLTANVGSFKILSRGPTMAQGTLTMTFAGTVLVSGLERGGTIITEGKIIREYKNDKYNRQAYHGTGKIIVKGKFNGLQWFGRDMSARFDGYAVIRAYGEFDKNLETGRWWYAQEPDKKRYWSPNGATPISVPKDEPVSATGSAPKKRSKGDN